MGSILKGLATLAVLGVGAFSFLVIKRMKEKKSYSYVDCQDLESKEQIFEKITQMKKLGYEDIVFEHGEEEYCYLCSLLDSSDILDGPSGQLIHFYKTDEGIATHLLIKQLKD